MRSVHYRDFKAVIYQSKYFELKALQFSGFFDKTSKKTTRKTTI